MICVDASVVVFLLVAPDHPVQGIWNNWINDQRELICPTLLGFEVVNAICQYQRHGRISPVTALQLVGTFTLLPVKVQTHARLHEQAINLASTYGATATYDAHYVALALLFGAELWTCDRRLVHRFAPIYPLIRLAE